MLFFFTVQKENVVLSDPPKQTVLFCLRGGRYMYIRSGIEGVKRNRLDVWSAIIILVCLGLASVWAAPGRAGAGRGRAR